MIVFTMQVHGELRILDDILSLLSLSLPLPLSLQTRVYEAMRRVDDVIDLKVTILLTDSHSALYNHHPLTCCQP